MMRALSFCMIAVATVALTAVAMPDRALAQSRPAQKPHVVTPTPKQGAATNSANVPNAVQGFSQNRDKPIQIDANSLEVRDKENIATFRGKVHVVQGDAELRCNVLTVFYEQPDQNGGNAPRSAIPEPSETQRIKRLEAKGNVVVTQKDQVATGDSGEFDMRKNLITLHGNVTVSQGKSVLHGDRLLVDMTTGVSHVESDNKGRVQGLFQPSKREEGPQGNNQNLMPKLH